MSTLKTRSFTVPAGSNFVCVPSDGGGPLICNAGDHILIVVAETFDEAAAEAIKRRREQRDPR